MQALVWENPSSCIKDQVFTPQAIHRQGGVMHWSTLVIGYWYFPLGEGGEREEGHAAMQGGWERMKEARLKDVSFYGINPELMTYSFDVESEDCLVQNDSL